MKQWIKLETDVMNDLRIMMLMRDMGMKGFGAYILLMLTIECYGGALPLRVLVDITQKFVRRNLTFQIIHNYGLFEVDDYSRVRVCRLADMHTDASAHAPTYVPAHVPAYVPAYVPAHEHISEENKNRIEKK